MRKRKGQIGIQIRFPQHRIVAMQFRYTADRAAVERPIKRTSVRRNPGSRRVDVYALSTAAVSSVVSPCEEFEKGGKETKLNEKISLDKNSSDVRNRPLELNTHVFSNRCIYSAFHSFHRHRAVPSGFSCAPRLNSRAAPYLGRLRRLPATP